MRSSCRSRPRRAVTPAIEQAIASGLPTTFTYDVELRRPSTFWFDKLVASARIAVTVRFEPLTRRYHVTLLQDGRVAEERTTDSVEDVRRWVSVFERLPLFTTRELQEHTDLRRPRPRPDHAAPYLVVLAVGASLGARQRRLHLPPMTPGRLRWLAPRRPLRDNPVLILLWIGLLVAALAAMLSLAARSSQLSLDFLSSVVLYAVSVADLTLMLALVFVLARNILKLVVERRRALPFARFRAKLVAALLGLTLIPAVLVLLVGSEIIRNAASRWFSPPIDTVISSAREIASDYYAERTRAVTAHATALARALSTVDLALGRSHDDPQHPRRPSWGSGS